jgi:hypothetical protein
MGAVDGSKMFEELLKKRIGILILLGLTFVM